jgi:hypothetical protein
MTTEPWSELPGTEPWSELPAAAAIDQIAASLWRGTGPWYYAWRETWGPAPSNLAESELRREHLRSRYDAENAALAAIRAADQTSWPRSATSMMADNTLRTLRTRITGREGASQHRDNTLSGTYDAVYALIAWPESAELLTAPVDQVRLWAALGQPAAILLLPARIALYRQQQAQAARQGLYDQL